MIRLLPIRFSCVVFITVTLILMACGDIMAEPEANSLTMLARMTQWLAFHDPIKLFGKVVDQNNDPVVGAEVIVAWHEPNLDLDMDSRSTNLITDADGRFEYRISKGIWPTIRSFNRDGYEMIYDQNSIFSMALEDRQDVLTNSSPSHPFILFLRKKGDATMLLKRNRIYIDANSPSNHYEEVDLVFFQRELYLPGQEYKDVQVLASLKSNDVWEIQYMATNGSDGIIVSDKILYEAPEDGYQQRVTIDNPPFELYLYLKSRAPPIYSRIDARHYGEHRVANPKYRISLSAQINPYGSRNLEYDVRLDKYWRINKHLTAEAKSLLANNQRPLEPDIDALLRGDEPETEK